MAKNYPPGRAVQGWGCLVVLGLIMLCLSPAARAQSDYLKARPDFQNQLYLAAPTNAPGTSLAQPASVTLASGSLGNATNVTNRAPNDGGSYLVQSAVGQPFFANPASLVTPEILTQPSGLVVGGGSNAALTVLVNSDSPVSYQWFRNGVLLAGATNATLVFNNPRYTNGGNYSVSIANASGSVTSQVAVLEVQAAPDIIVPPSSLTVAGMYDATFTVTAGGAESYQWRKDGMVIAGATNASYAITNVQPAHGGNYSVVASNAFGTVTSADALLTVTIPYTFTTFAGAAGQLGTNDGLGGAARFYNPYGLALDTNGNLYVADANNYTIRKITPEGMVSTVAGVAEVRGLNDGGSNTALFYRPVSVAVDPTGGLYVGDGQPGVSFLRRVTPAGVVTTLPQTYDSSYGGPRGVVVDGAGFAYATDTGSSLLMKITPGGTASVLAGLFQNGGTNDGTGSGARFQYPWGVAFDSLSNLFVTDYGTHTIRKVTPGGVVTTVAGQGGVSGSADGTGQAARFYIPQGLAVDTADHLFVVDTFNNTIRKITPAGAVTTIAGYAGLLGTNDGTGPSARFYLPSGVAVNRAGHVYVTDVNTHIIRKGVPANPVVLITTPGLTVAAGSAVNFLATISGFVPLLQWRCNGTNLAGATNATLSISNAQASGTYTLVASNVYGVDSKSVALTVIAPQVLSLATLGRGTFTRSTNAATYSYGESVVVTATPARYYAFLHWLDGETNGTRAVTIGASSNYYAALFTNTVALEELVFQQWEKVFGGIGDDYARVVRSTGDGGFILGGYSNSPTNDSKSVGTWGGRDYWVLKLDASGGKLWERGFGGTADEYVQDIVVASDGGFLLVGYSSSEAATGNKTVPRFGVESPWLIKLDANGNEQWQRSFGTNHSNTSAESARQTADGGFIFTGSSGTPGTGMWLVKLDANGQQEWEQTYSSPLSAGALSVVITPDGGYFLGGGYRSSPAETQLRGLKVGASGVVQADGIFGGNGDDLAISVTQIADGGHALVGYSSSPSGGSKSAASFGGFDYWLVRLNAAGGKLWDQSFGGSGNEEAAALQNTLDGGFLIGGYSASGTSGNKSHPGFGARDGWVVKTDARGGKQWELSLGGTGNDEIRAAQVLPDGYVLAGYTESTNGSGTRTAPGSGGQDYWIVKLRAREAPVGMPVIFVNGLLATNHTFLTTNAVTLSLSSTFTNAEIHYTLDGSDPDVGAELYGGPFTLSPSLTPVVIRAIAYDEFFNEALADPVTMQARGFNVAAAVPVGQGFVQITPPGPYLNNTLVTLVATASNGWAFHHWAGDLAGTNATNIITITGDVSAQAVFLPLYPLTVVSNGLGSVALDPQLSTLNYFSNTVVTLTATPEANWIFDHWTGDASGTNPVVQVTMNGARNVTAIFTRTFALAVGTPGGGSVSADLPVNPHRSNEVVTLTATASNGWSFLYWIGDAAGTNNPLALTMDRGRSVQAVFGTGLTTPTNINGVIVRDPANGPYPFGSVVRLVAVPFPGKYFNNWATVAAGQTISPLSFIVTNANQTVTAVYGSLNAGQFALTILINGQGGVTRTPQFARYTNGNSVTLTATPSGSGFVNWTGDASSTTNVITILMNTNKTVVANFGPPLGIVAVTPAASWPGSTVTIKGTNFSSVAGDHIVYFGAVRTVPTSAASTQLVVTVPAGASFSPVTVTLRGFTAASAKPFLPTLPAPTVFNSASLSNALRLAGPNRSASAVGDLDGDGRPDVVAASSQSGNLYVFQNTGTGGHLGSNSFAPPVVISNSGASGKIVLADLDNDGRLDITIANFVHRNRSSPGILTTNSFEAPVQLNAGGGSVLAVADLDLDGRMDLISGVGGQGTNQSIILILQNQSAVGSLGVGSFRNPFSLGTGRSGLNDVTVADLDNDGRPDLAAACGRDVALLRNVIGNLGFMSVDSFASPFHLSAPCFPISISAGDLDNDGRTDLMVAQNDCEHFYAFRNLGPTLLSSSDFSPRLDIGNGLGDSYFGSLGDLNGDGYLDVVIGWGGLNLFVNRGSGPLSTNSFFQYGSGGESEYFTIADLNGDGRPDIVTSGLEVLENQSTITNAPPTIAMLTPTNGSGFVAPAAVTLSASVTNGVGTFSRVQFFADSNLLATVTNAPFSVAWSNAPVGPHSVYATVTDEFELGGISLPVSFTVTTAIPSIALDSPTNGNAFTTSASVLLRAAVSDGDNSVQRVEFFSGTNLLGRITNAPYQLTWANSPLGSQVLSALAYDIYGPVITSALVTITVSSNPTNTPPLVMLNSPTNGQVFTAPVNVPLTALATDAVAVVRVNFFAGTNLLASVTQPSTNNPQLFSGTWSNVPVGSHVLRAVASNSLGLTATSTLASVTVQTALPEILLTSPTNNNVFGAPATIALRAFVFDADSSLAWVDFFQGGALLGSVTNPPAQPTHQLMWSNVGVGTYSISVVAHDAYGPVVTSPAISISVVSTATNPPAFSWSNLLVSVGEAASSVRLHVFKSPDSSAVAANIAVSTRDGSATAGGGTPDYGAVVSNLTFAAGETVKAITISILQDSLNESNQFFFVTLFPPTAGSIAGGNEATVTILDDDVPGTNSFLAQVPPSAPPSPLGLLRVNLLPTHIFPQWRLSWETTWRNAGTLLPGLTPGQHEIVFKPVAGFLEPLSAVLAVAGGVTNEFSFSYSNSPASQIGSLVVTIDPPFIATAVNTNARGQWKRQGEGVWHDSGARLDGIPAGTYTIEFKDVSDATWSKPGPTEVAVPANAQADLLGNYYVVNTSPGEGPRVLNTNEIRATVPPYGFCGQLRTPLGWGSGTVVKERVVLTAAHVIFDDHALAFVPDGSVQWFFQRHAGTYEPAPQTPRGAVVMSGYAAARGTNAPGVSTPAAQELDVAALYFNEPAGRGGFSGYLVSTGDELINAALFGTIVGYPVEVVPAMQRGQMHATPIQHLQWNSAAAPHVFSTTDVKTYPGNSGGPLCIPSTNSAWYPAAIFLGGSGNTVARVIDGAAAALIIAAEQAANDIGNSSGGEPPGQPCLSCPPSGIYAYLDIHLVPTNIGTLGGGYRFLNTTNGTLHRDGFTRYQVIGNVTNWTLEFTPADYHIKPQNVRLGARTGTTNRVIATYQPWGRLEAMAGHALRLPGASGVTYRIDFKSQLNSAAWTPVKTQMLTSASATLVPATLVPGASNGFFRAVLLP